MSAFAEVPRKVHMAILDKIGQEKQRVSERLARLDTERARLSQELGKLEIADRLLTQFGRRGMRTESKQVKGYEREHSEYVMLDEPRGSRAVLKTARTSRCA